MKIYIVSAVGEGKTLLSAFDNALVKMGVHNFNIIPLSSIIPPNTTIIPTKHYVAEKNTFGNKLYVVKAEIRVDSPCVAAAGIGWYQLEDKRGFFVEHSIIGNTISEVKMNLQEMIFLSLEDLCTSRGISFKKHNVHFELSVAKVINIPTCVITVAVYQSAGWK